MGGRGLGYYCLLVPLFGCVSYGCVLMFLCVFWGLFCWLRVNVSLVVFVVLLVHRCFFVGLG